jgi:hypothetical protein
LGTSEGVGTQPPAKDWQTQPGRRPGGDLTPLEEEMVAAAAAGELVDRGEGLFSLAEMRTWGEERTIRAAVLRHLLVAGQWPVHSVPSATQCASDYPCFYPAGYTVDTVIPIINVHQADYWGPDGHSPWGWVWVGGTWIVTGLGWALATLLVAGYTGLVRQD